ncbi:MAG: hypothetical protein ACTMUB_05460 [cyanobacterium endosymbiont of Rhopalodia musculus]|uniref:hypothetical protein n=1 Tax=cyanobacterium endosymbiont of Epithemia clementina EcSB TaxID=3034674 RepID=UPI0024819023|nr:hypothetical protein [cyanobacterium endosymbiont of Epithemia clementina EcSB]WGT67595.1 hypothetical protein P3F56_00320 [cyanobacterium endosymbiont of Epithemia clementina EcSB]
MITPPEKEKTSILPKLTLNVSLGTLVGLLLRIGVANFVEVRRQTSDINPLRAVKF